MWVDADTNSQVTLKLRCAPGWKLQIPTGLARPVTELTPSDHGAFVRDASAPRTGNTGVRYVLTTAPNFPGDTDTFTMTCTDGSHQHQVTVHLNAQGRSGSGTSAVPAPTEEDFSYRQQGDKRDDKKNDGEGEKKKEGQFSLIEMASGDAWSQLREKNRLVPILKGGVVPAAHLGLFKHPQADTLVLLSPGADVTAEADVVGVGNWLRFPVGVTYSPRVEFFRPVQLPDGRVVSEWIQTHCVDGHAGYNPVIVDNVVVFRAKVAATLLQMCYTPWREVARDQSGQELYAPGGVSIGERISGSLELGRKGVPVVLVVGANGEVRASQGVSLSKPPSVQTDFSAFAGFQLHAE
ncbi:hypothetical protein HYV58_00405 [Candidatus Peregrinibacteria bacterium]|nr:hypothetical protein [Candidatus Peregrinibacteria bacterium]